MLFQEEDADCRPPEPALRYNKQTDEDVQDHRLLSCVHTRRQALKYTQEHGYRGSMYTCTHRNKQTHIRTHTHILGTHMFLQRARGVLVSVEVGRCDKNGPALPENKCGAATWQLKDRERAQRRGGGEHAPRGPVVNGLQCRFVSEEMFYAVGSEHEDESQWWGQIVCSLRLLYALFNMLSATIISQFAVTRLNWAQGIMWVWLHCVEPIFEGHLVV